MNLLKRVRKWMAHRAASDARIVITVPKSVTTLQLVIPGGGGGVSVPRDASIVMTASGCGGIVAHGQPGQSAANGGRGGAGGVAISTSAFACAAGGSGFTR